MIMNSQRSQIVQIDVAVAIKVAHAPRCSGCRSVVTGQYAQVAEVHVGAPVARQQSRILRVDSMTVSKSKRIGKVPVQGQGQ